MPARLTIAVALLAATTAAGAAEPGKIKPAAKPAPQRPPALVLAAAEAPRAVQAPVVHNDSPRRPAGRVTSCRCGDPQAESETPDE